MFISREMAWAYCVAYSVDPSDEPSRLFTNRADEAMRLFLSRQKDQDVEWVAILEHTERSCQEHDTDDPVPIKYWKRYLANAGIEARTT